ncbi:hypothetical protein [Nostoc sp. LEGE 12450]|uniref:hypothetical protein n=1 Tax=Nostoc sp. LEGE 12450 TaxID=1828643 RepID=UPI001881B74A|nr:hypothetical protein [Nostoc sp. LEGE 12450]MBE8987480.1 hypothetical protein [Nostoc sp. LEGE 12450]
MNQNLSNKYEFVNDAIAFDILRDRILVEYRLGATATDSGINSNYHFLVERLQGWCAYLVK